MDTSIRPALTVVVPVYNAAAYLRECVDSILSQLWPGCRIILVDDGSSDGSEGICLDYAAANPAVVETVKTANAGVSEARNRGIAMATTPLIAFCDSDDAYNPGALGLMADIITKSGCGIVVGDFDRRRHDTLGQNAGYMCLSGQQALAATLYQRRGCHESAWAKVYRRSLFAATGFATGRRYEDIEILPRLYLEAGQIAFVNAPVYYYRPNAASFINTWSPSRADAVFATQSVLGYVTAHSPGIIGAARSRLFSAAYNIFVLATRHRQASLADDCWQIIKELRNGIMRNPRVRLKNKAGATISYLGKKTTGLISKLSRKP